jgi:hypothetical protein
MKLVKAIAEAKVGTNTFTQEFEKQVFETRDDVIEAMLSDKGLSSVLGNINYAIDLEERAKARQKIMAGPAKAAAAAEKAINDLVTLRNDAGMPTTKDEARQLIEMMKTMSLSALKQSA